MTAGFAGVLIRPLKKPEVREPQVVLSPQETRWSSASFTARGLVDRVARSRGSARK
jgi:hypothetical protein